MFAIFDFIGSLIDLIVNLVDFVITIFTDLLMVIDMLTDALPSIPTWLDWLPAGFVASLVAVFSIVIVYKIIGREG